ncbi:MAG: hypothetical protein ABJH68_15225 [Ilumatobacter sp.]|uniref:hypothetical protein n=1 Tax=Ilumatobacter sp. TaxID=1967498 RepID=UPI0032979FE1
MAGRMIVGASIVAVLLAAGCGSDDDSTVTSDSTPVTLGRLDDLVVTVPPDDFSGDPIRLEDTDDDGEVEIVQAEIGGVDASGASTADASSDSPADGTSADDRAGSESDDAGSDDEGANPFGGDDPEDGRMPDVVCMGLQDAQNEIQDRGVFFSRSVDATGDGRRQLFDRNWIVVAQDPEPGEPIGENEAVLSVVKTDEDNDC